MKAADCSNFLKRLCVFVNRLVGHITVFLFVIMFMACLLQVFTRYVLNNSLTWTDELARYTFVWAHLLGATICTWTGGHAALTFLTNRLPLRLGRWVAAGAQGVVFCVAWVLLVYGKRLLVVASFQQSPALGLSMAYVYVAVQVAAVLFMLYTATHMLEMCVSGSGQEEERA